MSPQVGTAMVGGEGRLGVMRKRESGSGVVGSPKVSKDSHRIRKPPLPLPQVQYRPPIIIHTYSPKVIHTEPDDFMSLVQKLTGSSDTRLRLKKAPGGRTKARKGASSTGPDHHHSSPTSDAKLERQGSGSSGTTNCGSPATSEESSFLLSSDQCHDSSPTMKQSNSPRSPLDSQFEFDNVSEAMFAQFDGSPFSQQLQVKAEPMFSSFNDTNAFTFFADSFMQAPVAPPSSRSSMSRNAPILDVHDQMQMPTGLGLTSATFHGLPDLSSPNAANWSQSFLDCIPTSAPSYLQAAPFQRQRFMNSGSNYATESSTMVALENIHAFMLT